MKSMLLILLLICFLSLSHQHQTTLRDRLSYIETKYDEQFEEIHNILEEIKKSTSDQLAILTNENNDMKENFEEFKQNSIQEQSALRERLIDLHEMLENSHIDNEKKFNYIIYDMDSKLLQYEEFDTKLLNEINATKIKLEENSVKFESQMNDFELKLSVDSLANNERINATIDYQVDAIKRLFNESLQSSISDLRKYFDEEQEKEANETLSNFSAIKDEIKIIIEDQKAINNTLHSNKMPSERLILNGTTLYVSHLAVLQNGDLASGGANNTINIWNTNDGSLKKSIYAHRGSVLSLATLKNGTLVSGSAVNTIKIWSDDFESNKFLVDDSNVGTLAVFSNGSFASGSKAGKIKMWSEDGVLINTIQNHTDGVSSIIVLPNDDFISASLDNTIKMWSADATLKKTIAAHSNWIYTLVLLKNGEFASGSKDKSIKIWSEDGELKRVFNVHNSYVYALAQLPNGDLACGFEDGIIKILSVNGKVKSSLKAHGNYVWSMIVLPNGELASASKDGTVKIWSL